MRIVIDLQGAQTESRFRGIGRYTLAFAKAVARNRGQHEVLIALNGLFPDTIEFIRDEFASLLPRENIRVWRAYVKKTPITKRAQKLQNFFEKLSYKLFSLTSSMCAVSLRVL